MFAMPWQCAQTYLNCGEFEFDASDARAESPGSCGSDVLWCRVEFCVEVDEGREMGSNPGSECLLSSTACAILKDGRSRDEYSRGESCRYSMGEAR